MPSATLRRGAAQKDMGKIIALKNRFHGPPGNLISSGPWEFRKAPWGSVHFSQFLKSQAEQIETRKTLPPHFVLKGSMAFSIRAIFANRGSEKRMREIYYLMGLMDCLINQVSPVLRTDLVRHMYREIFRMKKMFGVQYYGPLDHVLLPVDPMFFSEPEYRSSLRRARSLKDLYSAIRSGTDEMFDVLALEYVFYCPVRGE